MMMAVVVVVVLMIIMLCVSWVREFYFKNYFKLKRKKVYLYVCSYFIFVVVLVIFIL